MPITLRGLGRCLVLALREGVLLIDLVGGGGGVEQVAWEEATGEMDLLRLQLEDGLTRSS